MNQGARMTRIDFYVLSENQSRLDFVSRLVEKIYRQGHQLHIHTADNSLADRIDHLLWSSRDVSFIPHERAVGMDVKSPVTIGHDLTTPQGNEILVNLANDVPNFFSRFERVVEIIEAGDSHRQQGRVRYKYYRDRGYELTNHEID